MIDPKTLYIGSHVMVDGVRARVIRIDEPKDEHEIPPCTLLRFKTLSDGKWYDCGGPADSGKVEPIPITAELLTELGFELGNSIWRKMLNPEQCIYLCGDDSLGNYDVRIHVAPCGFSSFECTYLHELEAFLYLTTKTELIKE